MTSVKTFISTTKPQVLFGLWLKPVDDGFAAYIINSGTVKPLKVVDDKNTEDTKDDEVINLVGSVKDSKSANTINGAKAYAKEIKNNLIGKASDTPSDLTLYGLKNYIDSKLPKQDVKRKNNKA
jgi:hypothetical protein